MKKFLAITAAACLALNLAACSGSSSGSTSSSSSEAVPSVTEAESQTETSGTETDQDSTHKIGIVLKTLNSDYWQCVIAGINQAEADFGVEVELNGPPSETSYDEQMNMIETLLNVGEIEAIVIAPLQPATTANIVADSQIPVLAVDTTFESDKLLSFVGVSNYDAAYAMAEYAADKLGEGSNFILLAGVQADTTSDDRAAGYKDGLEANGCNVLEVQYTDAATDKAATIMEGMLQQYAGEIDGVLTHSDDVAMGAANIVSQAGKTDEIAVFGFGGISGAEPVKDGELAATVNINPYDMGYICVEKALAAINGESIEKLYPTNPEIIDRDNVEEFLVQLAEWTN